MNSVTGPQTQTGQQQTGISAEDMAKINEGVEMVAAGFLMAMHGEQKKLLNEASAETNK